MKTVAFVPAKGSSERIQNKNLSVLDGEYLFKHKLRQLLDCPGIDEVYLDTDNDEIASLAGDLPVKRLTRPTDLATNSTDGHALFAWECSQVSADVYIQALCTAPFVTAATIERALEVLFNSPSHDSLIAVSAAKQYTWSNNQPDYGQGRIPNSVDLPKVIVEAMSLYIARSGVLPSRRRFGHSPLLFELDPLETIDVNWPKDLVLAEIIASGIRAKENLMLGALTPYLSSAMISDITREMGYALTLPKEIIGEGRFFGRAKTLLLDHLQAHDRKDGIYDALNSYRFVRSGDVILVENRVANRAYFGCLNAQLAMRAGAVGAVVDGVTRDRSDVQKLNFPVFARGNYCVDIKSEGTVRAINMPIEIGGVRIENNDFVFADCDGVTIIPKKLWPAVRAQVFQGIEKEWQVGRAVALGVPPEKILSEFGEF